MYFQSLESLVVPSRRSQSTSPLCWSPLLIIFMTSNLETQESLATTNDTGFRVILQSSRQPRSSRQMGGTTEMMGGITETTPTEGEKEKKPSPTTNLRERASSGNQQRERATHAVIRARVVFTYACPFTSLKSSNARPAPPPANHVEPSPFASPPLPLLAHTDTNTHTQTHAHILIPAVVVPVSPL